jgi:hypothetical protein
MMSPTRERRARVAASVRFALGVLLIAPLLFVGHAGASTIDFSDPTNFPGADGAVSHTFVSDAGDTMVWAAPPPSILRWDAGGNGVGVDCIGPLVWKCSFFDDPTQVDQLEILGLNFLDNSVILNSVTVAGLHALEYGTVSGDTFFIQFDGTPTGLRTVEIGQETSWVTFTAISASQFSVKSLDFDVVDLNGVGPGSQNPIPEPSSYVLMLVGGLITGRAVRRNRRA